MGFMSSYSMKYNLKVWHHCISEITNVSHCCSFFFTGYYFNFSGHNMIAFANLSLIVQVFFPLCSEVNIQFAGVWYYLLLHLPIFNLILSCFNIISWNDYSIYTSYCFFFSLSFMLRNECPQSCSLSPQLLIYIHLKVGILVYPSQFLAFSAPG